ncbi:MAG: M1 family metallopeptidase [Lachnospiraceae bacterium]|nr:M1 family metallopeptidase [Lachnospiraceae bacterium]
MKKIGMIFMSIAICAMVTGCTKEPAQKTETTNEPTETVPKIEQAAENQSIYVEEYNMEYQLDEAARILSGKTEMVIQNNTDTAFSEIYIRYFPAVSSDGNILSAKEETKELAIKQEKDASTILVKLSKELLPQNSTKIEIETKTTVPNQTERFGYYSNHGKHIYQLSFCFPQLGMFDQEEWILHPYITHGAECTFNRCSNYNLTLDIPEGYQAVGTGDEKREKNTVTIQGKNLREMAVVVSDMLECDSFEVNGTKINHYYLNENKNSDNYMKCIREAAKDSFQIYTKYIGKYVYTELDIVQCKFSGGMEYPGLIMLGTDFHKGDVDKYLDADEYSILTAHEIAHEWFYGAVGNDQYKEAWLDEGLATFLGDILYGNSETKSAPNPASKYKKKYGMEYADMKDMEITQMVTTDTKINGAYDEYASPEDYAENTYDRASLLFYELKTSMGEQNFKKALQEYYKTYRLKEAYGQDLIDILKKYGAKDTILEKYIK